MTHCHSQPPRSVQRRARLARNILTAAFMFSACSAADGGDEADDSAASSSDPTLSGEVVGSFTVKLVAAAGAGTQGHTQIVGKVYDGVSPESIVWEEAISEAGCRLLTPRVPFCEEPCGGSAVCAEDNQCVKYPTAHAVGVVKVKGVRTDSGATEFTMKPIVNGYQPPEEIKLPFPAFAEGDTIQVEGVDADQSSFKIEAKGIAPLELTASERSLERDKPLVIEWVAKGALSSARMLLRLDISHHGGSKGKIECDVDDNGKLQLPAGMIAMLLDLGVAGFPTVIMTRESLGKVELSYGVVALRIDSSVEAEVVIPGLISCTKNEDCPSGATCQSDLQCK